MAHESALQDYDTEPLRIYHEHQSSQLCARHCLNNLLQGPYFTEFDLSQIALALDKEEQALLTQDGDADNGLLEWLKHNQSSQNVSDDGNFSIQVLRRALDNLSLKIYHFGNEQVSVAQAHPENETGFICNLQAHWFAIRRIGGQWYNLNSLSGLPETTALPTTISNFYLSAFLSTLQNDGYSIFVVRSDKWPHLHSYDAEQLLPPYAKWYLVSSIKARTDTYPKELLAQVNKSRNGDHVTGMGWGGTGTQGMTQDQMLEYAMMQSMGGGGGAQSTNANAPHGYGLANEDPELAEALKLSVLSNTGGDGNNQHNNHNHNQNMQMDMEMDEDAMLQQALAMSMERQATETEKQTTQASENTTTSNKEETMQVEKKVVVVDEPDESDVDACSILLRFPGNKRIERRFKRQHTLEEVAAFVKSEDSSFSTIVFVCPPSHSYHDLGMKLQSICDELNSKKLSFIVKENDNNSTAN
uniref:ubiquitinyl hydrolase 1 n=1 Tax=Elphidium margaritaceum TaxID=933848 RepID=A0A7S0XME4_9EUKA|eukprot:CAMPEP_0202700370 /NCGR_PEP_ID=MMETSP1385-20130828/13548_1 /ASSEMBLY_ACC=CAM_ASM_000861 /TAXON_ID=933848 /ORGANISM="Elphidium margaritaceum" /LENGTH=470 /DNA_ID=CAMNT_0049357529 /DNA_START=35 /DNA_END=1447 /DNA_ORIENTATION=-